MSTVTTVSTATGATYRAELLFGVGLGALALLSSAPRILYHDTLRTTFLAVVIGLAVWFAGLLLRQYRTGQTLKIERRIIPSHYVQGAVQASIFLYWSAYWELIPHNALLIIGQILFAFLFDALLSWTRNQPWRLGFGPFPIIFSTNLFLCFKDDWFYYQFAVVALAFLAKAFLTWERQGVRTHIFNPSAFPLFVFSILLLTTDATHLTWAQEIATRLNAPDHIFLWIFAVGLLVQGLFQVTLVTLAAALTLGILNLTYTATTGSYWFLDAGIPIAVFLGMHLLVTDPATSPRNSQGRFLFGALYGASVFALYGMLEYFGEPSFYDKLLCVPILNLLVRPIERLTMGRVTQVDGASAGAYGQIARWSTQRQNALAMLVWVLLFTAMYQTQLVGPEHPGSQTSQWRALCQEGRPGACWGLSRIYHNQCADGSAQQCLALAELQERLSTDTPRDRSRLLEANAWACEYGSASGCLATGRLLAEGNGVLLEQSCRDGDGSACHHIGASALKGLTADPDPQTAFTEFTRGCERQFGLDCFLLGELYFYGVATEQSPARAVTHFEQACDLAYAPACFKLSELYTNGNGVAANPGRASWYRHSACAIGLEQACSRAPNP